MDNNTRWDFVSTVFVYLLGSIPLSFLMLFLFGAELTWLNVLNATTLIFTVAILSRAAELTLELFGIDWRDVF